MEEVESASPARPVTVVEPAKVKKTVKTSPKNGGQTSSKRVPIPAPPTSAKEMKDGAAAPSLAPKPKSTYVPRVPKKGSRYFIMKSVNGPNLEYSMENGVWATQVCSADTFPLQRTSALCAEVVTCLLNTDLIRAHCCTSYRAHMSFWQTFQTLKRFLFTSMNSSPGIQLLVPQLGLPGIMLGTAATASSGLR